MQGANRDGDIILARQYHQRLEALDGISGNFVASKMLLDAEQEHCNLSTNKSKVSNQNKDFVRAFQLYSEAQATAELSGTLQVGALAHESIMELASFFGAGKMEQENRKNAAALYSEWGAFTKVRTCGQSRSSIN